MNINPDKLIKTLEDEMFDQSDISSKFIEKVIKIIRDMEVE